jgi:hypothetical protein
MKHVEQNRRNNYNYNLIIIKFSEKNALKKYLISGKPLLADHLVTFVEYNFIILLAFGGKKSL